MSLFRCPMAPGQPGLCYIHCTDGLLAAYSYKYSNETMQRPCRGRKYLNTTQTGCGRYRGRRSAPGLHAGTRTTANAARIIDGRKRSLHDSEGQHQEHEENQMQDADELKARRQEEGWNDIWCPGRTTLSIATHKGCHDTKRR